MKNILLFVVLTGSALVASAAVPVVSNVRAEQDKTSRKVTITYDLADAPAVITFDVLTNGVSIGAANITHAEGVGEKTEAGTDKTIVWDALVSWPNHKITTESVDFRVTAWATDDPPPVMVVNLTGDRKIRFYEDFAQLDGGIADLKYKTDCLVFRKIPAKGAVFTMGGVSGSGGINYPHKVAFTKDFYLGVYAVTQKQLLTITYGTSGTEDGWRGSTDEHIDPPASDVLPAQSVGYGQADNANKYHSLMAWSTWGRADQGTRSIYSGALLAKCRAFTGLKVDLPTAAQWEFACRAGTATPYSNGKGSDALDEIAWYKDNSDGKTHPVGLKDPNAWGLYDMHGNVNEWVLDKYDTNSSQYESYAIDPPGLSSTGANYVTRGGSYLADETSCYSYTGGSRYGYNVPDKDSPYGFRLWAPAEVP